MSKWISIEERLPDLHDRVLILDGGEIAFGELISVRKKKAYWEGENYDYGGCPGKAYSVTHWMPLPEPPK